MNPEDPAIMNYRYGLVGKPARASRPTWRSM